MRDSATPAATVAIPVLDGGETLRRCLRVVAEQRLDGTVEVLVCDSGSSDDSVAVARSLGARVIEIPAGSFSHGATRNLLMEQARAPYVAFLTQDAVPAGDRWLATLLEGFARATNVGLVFGPYLPAPGASPMVARELTEWFASFTPDGAPRVDRLDPGQRGRPAAELLGHRGYFTDANGCVSREAWQRVPFRAVAYAEDHLLAHDMLRAGYAKVYEPGAAVVHSHDYGVWGWLRRGFDEARAVAEIYGFSAPLAPRAVAREIKGRVGADWRWSRAHDRSRIRVATVLVPSTLHHAARVLGAGLGGRASTLPAWVSRRLSLERRAR